MREVRIFQLWQKRISAVFVVTENEKDVVRVNLLDLLNKVLEFSFGAPIGVIAETDNKVEVAFGCRPRKTVGIRDYEHPRLADML